MQLNLTWNKCEGGDWCKFYGVNLEDEHFDYMAGVYVIWKDVGGRVVSRVGQGHIRERMHQHRWEDDIMAADKQSLYLTWAGLDADQRDGVERFLYDLLKPQVYEGAAPAVPPIMVNLPW